jgi:hypothetical protein
MTPELLLALGVLAWLAGYLGVACRWWPYTACRRCSGAGKLRSPSGRAWRACPRCKGTGARLRTGRRLLNRWSDTARKSVG